MSQAHTVVPTMSKSPLLAKTQPPQTADFTSLFGGKVEFSEPYCIRRNMKRILHPLMALCYNNGMLSPPRLADRGGPPRPCQRLCGSLACECHCGDSFLSLKEAVRASSWKDGLAGGCPAPGPPPPTQTHAHTHTHTHTHGVTPLPGAASLLLRVPGKFNTSAAVRAAKCPGRHTQWVPEKRNRNAL